MDYYLLFHSLYLIYQLFAINYMIHLAYLISINNVKEYFLLHLNNLNHLIFDNYLEKY